MTVSALAIASTDMAAVCPLNANVPDVDMRLADIGREVSLPAILQPLPFRLPAIYGQLVNPKAFVKVQVLRAEDKNKRIEDAQVQIIDERGGVRRFTLKAGDETCSAILNFGRYQVIVDAPGRLHAERTVDINTQGDYNIDMSLLRKTGEPQLIRHSLGQQIEFSPNTAKLTCNAKKDLSAIAGDLRKHKADNVIVVGPEDDAVFSDGRARAVVEYLVTEEHLTRNKIKIKRRNQVDDAIRGLSLKPDSTVIIWHERAK